MKDFIIAKLLNDTTDQTLLTWWNEYDSETGYGSSQILESLEAWGETLAEEPADFARRVYFGDVQNWHDNYFWLNGYGNFESCNSLTSDKSPISFGDLASWLIDDQPNYIEEWIDEWEEQNETEDAETI